MKAANTTNLQAFLGGCSHATTSEFASATRKAPQTIRKNYCLTGDCFGIRPVKVGRSLLWPVSAIEVLLNGGA